MGNGSKSLEKAQWTGRPICWRLCLMQSPRTVDGGQVSGGFKEVDFTLDHSLLTQGQSELLWPQGETPQILLLVPSGNLHCLPALLSVTNFWNLCNRGGIGWGFPLWEGCGCQTGSGRWWWWVRGKTPMHTTCHPSRAEAEASGLGGRSWWGVGIILLMTG